MHIDKEFSILKGKTLNYCYADMKSNTISFKTEEDEKYILAHEQNCCEDVYIEDIEGNLSDLIGTPILIAEEVSSNLDLDGKDEDESFTWTFYKLATIKGHVVIRFYGSSNGYYSESVSFLKIP